MSTHKIKKIPNNKTHKKTKKKTQKIVVFDLDETLGHFSEMGILIEALSILKANHFFKENIISNSNANSKAKSNAKKDYFHTISKLFFNQLMDTYPEFMRPNMINIFEKLKALKKNKDVKIVLYTNNMGPRNWSLYIKNYIEHKINSKIFDKIITKYDRHHKHNCRTTHHKTYNDLIRCLKSGGIVSNNTNKNESYKHDKQIKILFFDDQNHPEMKHKNVKYVKLVPYQVKVPFQKMIQRFNLANSGEKDVFKNFFSLKPEITQEAFDKASVEILNTINNKHSKFRKKNDKATRKDLLESKKILNAIQKFTKSKSRKKKQKKTTQTRKLK